MPTASSSDFDFPIFFGGIFKKSLRFFGRSFVSFLLLSVVTFIPFLAFEALSEPYLLDLIEFFHGNFLDIIIFLTLPTIYLQGKVFPLPTLVLFFQRFFASVVVISCIQFSSLALFALFFKQVSIGIILVSMIPYIYLIFTGFFLIIENSPQLISVRNNLIDSIKLARTRFFSVFAHYFLITTVTALPFVVFFLWYVAGQPEFSAFEEVFRTQPENSTLLSEKLLGLLETFNRPEFKWPRIGIHIVTRPIKSLFLSFLFLGILFRLNPQIVKSFLGFDNPEIEEDLDDVPNLNDGSEETDQNQ